MSDYERNPEIQCGNIQNKLRALEVFSPDIRNRILERFPKTTLQIVNKAKSNQWVPVHYSVELSDCVAASMTEHPESIREEKIFNWSLKAATYSIESSLVAPFMRAALNLLMIKSTIVLKMCPQLWETIHRNCGKLIASEKKPGYLEIRLKDMPPVMVKSRPYLIGVTAFIKSMLNFGRARGNVVLEEISEDTNSAVLFVTWDPDIASQIPAVRGPMESLKFPSRPPKKK
jgi:hypothetical protein